MATTWTMIAVQLVIALIFITLVYMLATIFLRTDSLVVSGAAIVKPMSTTPIVVGYASSSLLANKRFNTISPYADGFKLIGRSVNTAGGAQFSYQFWIRIDDTDASNFQDLVILLKGDKRKFKMGLYDPVTLDLVQQRPDDYYIACPMLKFVDSYTNMMVQFGTSAIPNVSLGINMNPNSTDGSRRNLLSLLPVNWAMMTLVFEDNVSVSDGKVNGISFTFYMNDVPYQINSGSTNDSLKNNYLKQNDGDINILPNPPSTSAFLTLGNISYSNYALSQDEVSKAYLMGPPSTPMADDGASRNGSAPILSAYNKIDLYNY